MDQFPPHASEEGSELNDSLEPTLFLSNDETGTTIPPTDTGTR